MRQLLFVGVTGAVALGAGVVHAQTDLDVHLDAIRKSGMSEYAAGDLRSAAALLGGASMLKVQQGPGAAVSWTYEPTKCFLAEGAHDS